MKAKELYTELMVNEGKIVYAVNGSTYEAREELKKSGFEWNPMNSQWEMVLTGTRKEIVAQAKKLNEELESCGMYVDFSVRASNIALHKAFAE